MNAASLLIMSNSLSAFMILLTLDMGKSVVPGCFSASDWRCFRTRFGPLVVLLPLDLDLSASQDQSI
jgi:hypothetical protein